MLLIPITWRSFVVKQSLELVRLCAGFQRVLEGVTADSNTRWNGPDRGMGLAGKVKGMTGELAPVLWAQGKREEVLAYVAQDVRTTLELAQVCESRGELRWVARSGRLRSMALGDGWLTVREALSVPENPTIVTRRSPPITMRD